MRAQSSVRSWGWKAAVASAATCGLVMLGVGPVYAALPSAPTTTGITGARPSATRYTFNVSDQTQATVDVGTGNLLVTQKNPSLPGISHPTVFAVAYNSLASGSAPSLLKAPGWSAGVQGTGSLSKSSNGIVYTDSTGATWPFTAVSGQSNAYTAPAGLKAMLTSDGTTYTLTDLTSREAVTYDANGLPTKVTDRNGNVTTITAASSSSYTITSTAGSAPTSTTGSSRATESLDAYGNLVVSQTSGSSSRSVKYTKDSSGNLTSITDAAGATTSFAYAGGVMTKITGPTGAVTTFQYDSSTRKLSEVDQQNTSSGSPGTSTTKFSYTTGQTVVTPPDTVAGSTSGQITYTINTTQFLVNKVVDAAGRVRSATYTPNSDVASSTVGSGSTAGTTSGAYNANNGQSLTQVTQPGGASSSAAYGNTAASTAYLPSSSTDSAGNRSTYQYNGAGNALSSTNAMAAQASLTYNTNGTVATATAPGNSSATTYGYDANHQLSSVTAPSGSNLGTKNITYDAFGRTATKTDGAGHTTTYAYDNDDRVTKISFSDSTPSVSYTYDTAGRVTKRVDASGTTTYAYDQLGRLTSTANTAGGGTISYAYDQGSNLVSMTDSRGTTTYQFDASGVPTSMKVIQTSNGSATENINFAVDANGNRTDEWFQTNPTNTVWADHIHTDYDSSGRVTRVIAQYGTGNSSYQTAMDTSYCYNVGSAAPTCSTNTATDRSKLAFQVNNINGMSTSYTYDAAGRLSKVAQSGSSGINDAYGYDARGNRISAVASGAASFTQNLTMDSGNNITTAGFTHDAAGNLTAEPGQTFSYNGAGQMTGSTSTSGSTTTTGTYTYAGATQNELLSEKNSSTTFTLAYGKTDQTGQPQIEQVTNNGNTAYVEHDPVTGQPLLLRTSSGTQSIYVYDGTGSPAALLTSFAAVAFAYTYDPYGVPTLTAGGGGLGAPQNPYTFKGGTKDVTTDLIHFGARWYDDGTGRWDQQDTLDAPLDPANANRYAYAADDPINNLDPTGLSDGVNCAISIAAFVAGAAALGALAVAGAPETGGGSLVAYGLGVTAALSTAGGGIIGTAAFC